MERPECNNCHFYHNNWDCRNPVSEKCNQTVYGSSWCPQFADNSVVLITEIPLKAANGSTITYRTKHSPKKDDSAWTSAILFGAWIVLLSAIIAGVKR
jgi:hypothetical protein